MEDELVKVSIFTKTGHEAEFAASAFRRISGGYEFISYPERRGFKRLRRVFDDAVVSVSIEAPEPFFESLQEPEPVRAAVPAPAAAPADYVNPLAQRLKDPKANRAIPVKDPEGQGRPLSVVSEYTKDGEERQVQVGASMVKM